MSAPHDLFAACQPGLEPLLVRELQALGAEPRALRGGAAFRGDVRLLMRACLWLGTASHVMLRLREFPCRLLCSRIVRAMGLQHGFGILETPRQGLRHGGGRMLASDDDGRPFHGWKICPSSRQRANRR